MEGERSPINLPRCEGLDVSGEEWEEQVVFSLVVSSSPSPSPPLSLSLSISVSVSLYLCLCLRPDITALVDWA